jgi:SAM-dependent methyltransferase
MAGEPDDVDAMVEPVVPSRHRWLAGLLAAGPGDRVVDLGCGTGASLVQAAPAVPGGLLAGVDLSAAALAWTAETLGEAVAGLAPPPAVLCLQADLKAPLPLADAAFDRVVCHNVLECLPDPGALVAEAVRVLAPEGRLVLAHSDYDTLIFASEDLSLTRRLVRDYSRGDGGHPGLPGPLGDPPQLVADAGQPGPTGPPWSATPTTTPRPWSGCCAATARPPAWSAWTGSTR